AYLQHRGDDRAGPGQQRRTEGNQGDVGGRLFLRVIGLAGQQLQRDEDEQQAARALERRQIDLQVVEDLLAGHGEDDDDAQRQGDGLPGGAVALAGGQRAGQREEDRHHARRVGDDEQG